MRKQTQIVFIIAAFVLGIGTTMLVTRLRGSRDMEPTTSASDARQATILYWYDPMVPQQHFDKPGKSPFMDMQLVPKYADSADLRAEGVRIAPHLTQNLGVRTARASHGTLESSVRVGGSIVFDERAVSVVQARVAGIVEHLAVRAPLDAVEQGQPLLTLLAPEWTSAQEEYLALRRASANGLDTLRRAARQRLLLLGMNEAQVRVLERSGQAQSRITLVAPRDGVIAELSIREGAKVAIGDPLLRINGLDSVWIEAAVPETQSGRVSAGSRAEVHLPAFPGETLNATVEAILPEIDKVTRTQTARIVMANPERRLSPGMFAWITLTPAQSTQQQLLVPSEAVIATGTRQVVIVDIGQGRFQSRQVRLGDEAAGMSVILEGLNDGDKVVVSGQFLIDSEASLSGTLNRLNDATDDAGASTQQESAPAPAASGNGERP